MGLESVRHLLIDMDGVLYRGGMLLAGAGDLVEFLRAEGIGLLMVTNNSTLTRTEFAARLERMGVHVDESEIMTSAVATAEYLRTLAPAGTVVNVVGESGLIYELQSRGFVMGGRDAEYVVCGWDKTITYDKLATATIAIRNGATFIGTNPDKTYPLEHDIVPGAGSIIASLVASTDVEPTIVGKPQTIIMDRTLAVLGATAADTAMLGDRLDTDILGGQNAGMLTILVLTGISTAEEAAQQDTPPDRVVADLPALLTEWRAALEAD